MSDHRDYYLETNGFVDLIEEIRLRTWARENYTQPEQRRPEWNPIVLEEMELRDHELAT